MGTVTRTGAAYRQILVVEDDEAIRETLSDLLQDEGYSVASAENGVAALGYLKDNELPQVILLDLMMPVMSGAEFRQKQLAEPRIAGIPTVVMTAADRGRAIASDLHADGFVGKPPSIDLLLDTVQRYC